MKTFEEVNEGNSQVTIEVIKKIDTNHWSPAEKCPKCKEGIIGQIGLFLVIGDKKAMIDGVICNSCLTVGMKCAKYKGEKSCSNSYQVKILKAQLKNAEIALAYYKSGKIAAEEIAKELYETYNEAVGGKDYRGEPLPTWQDFRSNPDKKRTSDGWVAMGALVVDMVVDQ